jgi:CubicO group peptidase (beta-lactamase class C family)
MIIEKVSGESYEQFLYENLWKPSNMETTGYTRPNFDNGLIAIGYTGDEVWGGK